MRKLLILLALVPFIVNGQTPEPLVELAKYHNYNRLFEMADLNFTNITEGVYTQPTIESESINAGAMYYTDTYWDDLRVPLSNTRLNPALTEPDFEDNGTGLFAWGFDADGDSTEVLNFIAQLPHSYKEGTNIDAHLHWQPETTNTGDVVWKLNYAFASIDSSFSAVDSFWVVQAGAGVALGHQVVEFGDIDGTDIKISAIIMGNLSRVGDHTEDDFTGIADGLEIDFHYQIDQPGSSNEYSK